MYEKRRESSILQLMSLSLHILDATLGRPGPQTYPTKVSLDLDSPTKVSPTSLGLPLPLGKTGGSDEVSDGGAIPAVPAVRERDETGLTGEVNL
jgi:hypothetical protein